MSDTRMLWKVCGMKNEVNIRQVAMLRPDFMGFIFFKGSPRYVGENFSRAVMEHLGGIRKVGVFVDQATEEILDKAAEYRLDYVQLHGHETPGQVKELSKSVKVIKAISGNAWPGRDVLKAYEPYVDYFLADTRHAGLSGGTGEQFDWEVLKNNGLSKGILLSGGIGIGSAGKAAGLTAYGVVGIDINSKAEDAPGWKNLEKLKQISDELHG